MKPILELSLLLLVLVVIAPVTAQSGAWRIETVDEWPWMDHTLALAVDSSGNPHIVYGSEGNPYRYAWKDSLGWHIQELTGIECSTEPQATLVLNKSDVPYLCYHTTTKELQCARPKGSRWDIMRIDPAGIMPSMAITSRGTPYISYHDPNERDLKYAWEEHGAWSNALVDSAGNVGWPSSIAIDSMDYPHIGYKNSSNQDLKYILYGSRGWQKAVVVDQNIIHGPSLALSSLDYPYLLYSSNIVIDHTSINRIKLAWKDAQGWHNEIVSNNGGSLGTRSLALDSADYPHICYRDALTDELKYATKGLLLWRDQTLVQGLYSGINCQIALDAKGNPHVTYVDLNSEQRSLTLKHAWFDTHAHPVTACGVIDSPGTYVLQNDILDSSEPICIRITSSDVVFEGNDHRIDGICTDLSRGLDVDPSLTNVTIRHVTTTQWGWGIHYRADNGQIEGVNAFSNDFGIIVTGVHHVNITHNNVSFNPNAGMYIGSSQVFVRGNIGKNNQVGISLEACHDSNITGNIASENLYEGIHLYDMSENNQIIGNEASRNSDGISLNLDCAANTISDNIVTENTESGIHLEYADGNTLENNTASRNGKGVFLTHSHSTYITRNQASSNEWGFVMEYSNRTHLKKNVAFNNTLNGFSAMYFSSTTMFDGNIAHNNHGNGIELYSSSNTAMLSQNKMYNNSGNGMLLQSASHTSILSNDVYNNRYGITIAPMGGSGEGVVGSPVPENNSISSNHLFQNSEHGIYLTSTKDTTISLNNLTHQLHGMEVFGAESTTIAQNEFYEVWPGIHIFNSHQTSIIDNTIRSCMGGIYDQQSDSTIAENTIANSLVAIGLYYGSGSWIHHNTLVDNEEEGIHIQHSRDISIDTNTLKRNAKGITLENVSESSISNNLCDGNTQYNIHVDASSENTLTGNTISDTPNGYGIWMNNSFLNTLSYNHLMEIAGGVFLRNSSNNLVVGNELYNGTDTAISSGISMNNVYQHNILENNAEEGIAIGSSRHEVIENNSLRLNGYGIQCADSHDSIIQGNWIEDSTQTGIRLDSLSQNNTVSNNWLNNTKNFAFSNPFDTNPNRWNSPLTPGLNIIGGPYIGGNYWATPEGTGYSETCDDTNHDGICDSSFVLAENNVDYFPLHRSLRGDLNGNGVIDWGDVVMCAYMSWNLIPPVTASADFNGSGAVDWGDVVQLAYYYWGLVSEL